MFNFSYMYLYKLSQLTNRSINSNQSSLSPRCEIRLTENYPQLASSHSFPIAFGKKAKRSRLVSCVILQINPQTCNVYAKLVFNKLAAWAKPKLCSGTDKRNREARAIFLVIGKFDGKKVLELPLSAPLSGNNAMMAVQQLMPSEAETGSVCMQKLCKTIFIIFPCFMFVCFVFHNVCLDAPCVLVHRNIIYESRRGRWGSRRKASKCINVFF